MAYGEDTAMERVKAADGQAMIDGVVAQTHSTELPPGNDAVLARGQQCDLPVPPPRGTFGSYVVLIRPLAGHASRLAELVTPKVLAT